MLIELQQLKQLRMPLIRILNARPCVFPKFAGASQKYAIVRAQMLQITLAEKF